MKHLILVTVALGFLGLPTLANASNLPNHMASKIAESFFFTATKSKNIGEFVKALPLSSMQRSAIQAYLRDSKIDSAALPEMRWHYGSKILVLGSGQNTMRLNFSKFPRKHLLLVNNNPVRYNSYGVFKNLVKKIRIAGAQKSISLLRFSKWFESTANASETGLIVADEDAIGAIDYWTAAGLISACTGGESLTRANCPFRSNSAMIQSDLATTGLFSRINHPEISKFICNGNRFSQILINYKSSAGGEGLQMTYDKSGQIDGIGSFGNGGFYFCQVKGNKIITEKKAFCRGRTLTDYRMSKHWLNAGTVKVVGDFPVPVQRLESCCKSSSCKKTMAAIVARNNSSSSIRPGNSTGAAK